MRPKYVENSDGDPVFASAARVETDRAGRYLVQLCTHATKMGEHLPRLRANATAGHVPAAVQHVEWSDADGTMIFGLGRCTLHATTDALILRLEAANEENLQHLQNLIAHRLQTIGSREHLVVHWQQLESSGRGNPPLVE